MKAKKGSEPQGRDELLDFLQAGRKLRKWYNDDPSAPRPEADPGPVRRARPVACVMHAAWHGARGIGRWARALRVMACFT